MYTGAICKVRPFNPIYKLVKNVPIVKAVTAYDTDDGETLILCFNQALYFGNDLPNFLLNPNQMWLNGLIVDDCPLSLSPDKSSTHSIHCPEDDVIIPLHLTGKPKQDEIKSC
jgi:hypothetical protein